MSSCPRLVVSRRLMCSIGRWSLVVALSLPQIAAAIARPTPGVQAAWLAFRAAQPPGVSAAFDAKGRIDTLQGFRFPTSVGLSSEDAAREFLLAQGPLFDLLPDLADLTVTRVSASPSGAHVELGQVHGGLDVVGGMVQVDLDAAANVFLVHNAYVPAIAVSVVPVLAPADAVALALASVQAGAGGPIAGLTGTYGGLGISDADDGPRLVHRVRVEGEEPMTLQDVLVDDLTGTVLRAESMVVEAVTGSGQIFDPNPVNRLADFSLRDQDDANAAVPAKAYDPVALLDLNDAVDGLFSLIGPWVRMENIRPPANTPPRVADENGFVFLRHDERFEDVMTYAHVDRNQRYLQTLGFTINKRSIRADAHGTLEHNAFYVASPPGAGFLIFGDGRVDAAEDADIILHEYGHAMQDDQNPGAYLGAAVCNTDHQAMGEGFGDYWAASNTYDKSVEHDFPPACFGEWFGTPVAACTTKPCPPTCARRLDTTKHNPEDRHPKHECHADGEIWSGGLWDIFNALKDRRTTDQIVVESHYLVPKHPDFNQGACALLFADLDLFAGRHLVLIGDKMRRRGLLTGCVPCTFDTDGDGEPDLVLPDADGDGICEFPDLKTHLRGVLHFTRLTPVEFRGTTLIEADRIVIYPNARLFGERSKLRSLTMVAVAGDLESHGTLELGTSDDLVLTARGSVDVDGKTALAAADRLVVEARQGNVTLAPPAAPAGPFTALGGNRVDILAKGANGRVEIARATIGGARVTVDTHANVSVIGDKRVWVHDRALLTTDRARTGLPVGSDVAINSTGRVLLQDTAVLDAGRNVTIATTRAVDGLCLSGGVRLEARDPAGRLGLISLTGVRGGVRDDGSTAYVGQLRSGPIAAGPCP